MIKILFMIIPLIALCSCSGTVGSDSVGGDTLTTHSRLLSLVNTAPGVTVAKITNPWDTARTLQCLVLMEGEPEGSLPDGTVVRVPVKSSLVSSVTFAHAIAELGGCDAINAVTDAAYFKTPAIVDGLRSGRITDAGSSMQPNPEIITACSPDIILSSPYENAGHGVIETLGIPIIEMADYMEETPLGRAEWIKLLGVLYGNYAAADSIFNATSEAYTSLSATVWDELPRVITETPFNGVWYTPGGRSYMARIFSDAGADYPWKDDDSAGSLQLDFATVYNTAHDADVWFIKTDKSDFSYNDLRGMYPLNEKFKAYADRRVYFLDTTTSFFFEEMAVHPDRLLRDIIIILHPDSMPGEQPRYYHPLNP